MGKGINPFIELEPEHDDEVFRYLTEKDGEGITNGRYIISNYGRLFSLTQQNHNKNKEMKPDLSVKGYYRVTFSKDGITKRYSVHRLVLNKFAPDHEPGQDQVNHKQGIKTFNYVNLTNPELSSIEWMSAKENINHSFDTKLNPSRTDDEILIKGYEMAKAGASDKEIMDALNVSHHMVRDIRCSEGRVGRRLVELGYTDKFLKTHSALTDEEVISIYNDLASSKYTDKEIANKYNVKLSHVNAVRYGHDRYGAILKKYGLLPLHKRK